MSPHSRETRHGATRTERGTNEPGGGMILHRPTLPALGSTTSSIYRRKLLNSCSVGLNTGHVVSAMLLLCCYFLVFFTWYLLSSQRGPGPLPLSAPLAHEQTPYLEKPDSGDRRSGEGIGGWPQPSCCRFPVCLASLHILAWEIEIRHTFCSFGSKVFNKGVIE